MVINKCGLGSLANLYNEYIAYTLHEETQTNRNENSANIVQIASALTEPRIPALPRVRKGQMSKSFRVNQACFAAELILSFRRGFETVLIICTSSANSLNLAREKGHGIVTRITES